MKIEQVTLISFKKAQKLARKLSNQEVYSRMNEMEPDEAISVTYEDPEIAYRRYRAISNHVNRSDLDFEVCYIRTEKRIYIHRKKRGNSE